MWDSLTTLFLESVSGSYIILTMLGLAVIWLILTLIRAQKETFVGVSGIYMYYLIPEGILPAWTFFIVLAIGGAMIGSSVIKLIFGG